MLYLNDSRARGTNTDAQKLCPSGGGVKLGYQPALDGIRGVAVLAVILFHSGVLPGGFLGVDAFFVLSGFLITTLLIKEQSDHGKISAGGFYRRRALRLIPALSVLLILWLGFVHFFRPSLLLETRKAELTTLFYCSNLVPVFKWNVWLGPLSHTWSLSIEEQFYLTWPLALVVMLRRRVSPVAMLCITLSAATASSITRGWLWMIGGDPLRLYNGLDTRADALLIGCALGIAVSYRLVPRMMLDRGASLWTPALSILFLLPLLILADWRAPYLYLGGFTLVAFAVAVLVNSALIEPRASWLGILEWRWLVWIGRISYGLYLWHLPVFEVVKNPRWPAIAVFFVRIAATFVIAATSYYVIEKPCLRLKNRAHSRRDVPPRFSGAAEVSTSCAAASG